MSNFLKWGIFIAAANIVITLVEYFAGLTDAHGNSPLRWVAFIIVLGLLFWGILEKKKQDPGEFTFGKGWVEGFLISLIGGVILSIFLYIYFSMISPETIDMIHAQSIKDLTTQRNIPPESMEGAKKAIDFMVSPTGFSLTTLFMYGIGGMIFSLIFAPIIKGMSAGNTPPAQIENA